MPLSSAPNVLNTCLRILRARGYDLRLDDELWIARKGGFTFMADNPIELLGLTAIYDYVQPAADADYWWSVPGPNILGEFLDNGEPPESEDFV